MSTLIATFSSWYAALVGWLAGMDVTTGATITAAVATVVIAVATIYYVRLTHQLVVETRKQMMLTQEPVVRIMPEGIESEATATFTLVLLNSGIAAIEDVRVYTDYFVALKPKDQPLRLIPFVGSEAENSPIPRLDPGERDNVHIEFRNIYDRMGQIYVDPKLADPTLVGILVSRMNVLRLFVEYRRAVDGRPFTTAKVYIIGGNASDLATQRVGLDTAFPTLPAQISFQDITTALGVRT